MAVTAIVGDLASPVNDTAKNIKQDFVGIDARVGQEGRGGSFGSHVVGHANSIDCSAPFDLLGLSNLLEPLLTPILGGNPNPSFGGSGCRR